MKKCIDCGSDKVVERRRCKDCVIIHNRQRAKKYYRKDRKRYGVVLCEVCGEELTKNRPEQTYHGRCRKFLKTIEKYNSVKRNTKGSATVGRQKVLDLGLKLHKSHCVHHIDLNPNNNDLSNLMIVNRSIHAKIHALLQNEWWSKIKESEQIPSSEWMFVAKKATASLMQTESYCTCILPAKGNQDITLEQDTVYLFKHLKSFAPKGACEFESRLEY